MGKKAKSEESLIFCGNSQDFFHTKIIAAEERNKIKLPENVEFYLVNLLCDFIRVDEYLYSDCLALTLKEAMESSEQQKASLYKKLADSALYFAGCFQEYFNRKSFSIGYYVSMGENAYSELSVLLRNKSKSDATLAKIYKDMAKYFMKSVDILTDVAEHTSMGNPSRSDLSIYDVWLDTQSEKLEKELLNRGIIPVKVTNKKFNN